MKYDKSNNNDDDATAEDHYYMEMDDVRFIDIETWPDSLDCESFNGKTALIEPELQLERRWWRG